MAQDIITPQGEPTSWVSSLTCPCKASDTPRVFLDLKDLKRAIIQEHHNVPTLKAINTQANRFNNILKIRCQEWVLEHPPHISQFPALHFQHTLSQIPLQMHALQAENVTGCPQMKMDQIVERCLSILCIHNESRMTIFSV